MSMFEYRQAENGVVRTWDGIFIPANEKSEDWQEYRQHIERGGAVLPMIDDGLRDARVTAKATIDDEAAKARARYITPGMEAVYSEKARQCELYIADGCPGVPDPLRYSYVVAEKAARGDHTTFKQAATAVLVQRDSWAATGAKIEQARLTAKFAIDRAGDQNGIDTAVQVGLAALAAV